MPAHAPSVETRFRSPCVDPPSADCRTAPVAQPQARADVRRGMAGRAAAPVRPRTGLRARAARRRHGGKAALERGFQPPFSEVYLRYGAVRRLCFRASIECPPALAGKGAALFGDGADPAAGRDAFLRAARKAGHDVRFHEDARAFVARQRDAVRRCEALAAAFPKGAQSPALRKLLKVPLYAYQAEGALFAARAGRSLIGDDMGLGKTIQAIAAAELLTRHAGAERVQIVCPVSLKHQWQREIARFSGRAAEVVQGPREARRAQWADVREPGVWAKITNYETLARDLDLINAWAHTPSIAISRGESTAKKKSASRKCCLAADSSVASHWLCIAGRARQHPPKRVNSGLLLKLLVRSGVSSALNSCRGRGREMCSASRGLLSR